MCAFIRTFAHCAARSLQGFSCRFCHVNAINALQYQHKSVQRLCRSSQFFFMCDFFQLFAVPLFFYVFRFVLFRLAVPFFMLAFLCSFLFSGLKKLKFCSFPMYMNRNFFEAYYFHILHIHRGQNPLFLCTKSI